MVADGELPTEVTKPVSPVVEVPSPVPSVTVVAPNEETVQGASEAMLDFDMLCIPFVDSACMVRFRVNEIRFGTGVRNLRFTLEDQHTGEKREISPKGRRTGERKVEFTANFPSYNIPGPYTWYVTVECCDDGRKFEGEFVLFVNRLVDARKVASQLSVTINNNIHNGPATDMNLNINAAEALDRILKSPEDPLDALRHLVYGKERAWSEVELYEVERKQPPPPPPPPCPPPPPKGPERLTLTCGDEVLQLVSDNCVTFGRNRANVIPLRVCGPGGRVDPLANDGNISRFHFRIERVGHDCVLRDGGNEPSSFGTRVNGVLLPPLGRQSLVANRAYEIEAGRSGVALKMRVVFYRDSRGQAAGFVLDRLDGARQRVCAVWSEEPLGDGVSVSWDGRCWMLHACPSEQIPLSVGTRVSVGGSSFEVQPFHQTHLT